MSVCVRGLPPFSDYQSTPFLSSVSLLIGFADPSEKIKKIFLNTHPMHPKFYKQFLCIWIIHSSTLRWWHLPTSIKWVYSLTLLHYMRICIAFCAAHSFFFLPSKSQYRNQKVSECKLSSDENAFFCLYLHKKIYLPEYHVRHWLVDSLVGWLGITTRIRLLKKFRTSKSRRKKMRKRQSMRVRLLENFG